MRESRDVVDGRVVIGTVVREVAGDGFLLVTVRRPDDALCVVRETLPDYMDWKYSVEVCTAFCIENDLEPPYFERISDAGARELRRELLGYYSDDDVAVRVQRCRPNGHHTRDDCSVLGVTAHETGHHVHRSLGDKCLPFYDVFMKRPSISPNAATNWHEDIADSVQMLITNPTLLEEVEQSRHRVLTEIVGLRSLGTRHWRELCDPDQVKGIERVIREGTMSWTDRR